MSRPSASAPSEPSFREVCLRCERPASTCLCAHLTALPTRTRVLLLQHPRERHKAIGTARLAHLCLPNSALRVGVRFEDDPVVQAQLTCPSRPAILLYPGPTSAPLEALRHAAPHTLVVLDGTWPQSKILLRENPTLAKLPRYAFTPATPSEYRIRREPALDFVSTLESLALALTLLEGEPGEDVWASRFHALYAPFRAMVDLQLQHQAERSSPRQKRPRLKSRAERFYPELVRALGRGDLVCLAAEANAWPYQARLTGGEHYPDELVHVCAVRLSTGARFDHVVRPRHPIAPNTESHTRLTRAELEAGETLAELCAAWAAFARPDDTVCAWGPFALDLFSRTTGVELTDPVDLRDAAKKGANGRVGVIEAFLASFLDPAPEVLAVPPSIGRGRAGVRGAQALAVVRRLIEGTRRDP